MCTFLAPRLQKNLKLNLMRALDPPRTARRLSRHELGRAHDDASCLPRLVVMPSFQLLGNSLDRAPPTAGRRVQWLAGRQEESSRPDGGGAFTPRPWHLADMGDRTTKAVAIENGDVACLQKCARII